MNDEEQQKKKTVLVEKIYGRLEEVKVEQDKKTFDRNVVRFMDGAIVDFAEYSGIVDNRPTITDAFATKFTVYALLAMLVVLHISIALGVALKLFALTNDIPFSIFLGAIASGTFAVVCNGIAEWFYQRGMWKKRMARRQRVKEGDSNE